MVTYTDIGRAISKDKTDDKVTEIMTPGVISIDQESPMYEAVSLMNQNKIGRLLVTEDGKPKGMITRMDVISRLTTLLKAALYIRAYATVDRVKHHFLLLPSSLWRPMRL